MNKTIYFTYGVHCPLHKKLVDVEEICFICNHYNSKESDWTKKFIKCKYKEELKGND